MKIYCSCCDKVQPVRIDNCRDAKTNEPYQDIVCATCDLVIASGTDIAQPYPDNFIDALKYDVARRDSEAQQAYEDAFVNGTGVMLGDKRIDPANIYKEPEQEQFALKHRIAEFEGAVIGLQARLAQPEQEPVAWMHPDGRIWTFGRGLDKSTFTVPLYTSPPHRKPLTDQMVKRMKENCESMEMRGAFADGWLSAEAAHGIKEQQ